MVSSFILLAFVGIGIATSRFTLGVLLSAVMALLFLAICGSLAFLLLEASTRLLRSSRDTRNRLRLLLGTILVLLVSVELVLRIGVRRYATYPEQNGFSYGTLYELHHTSWYFTFATLSKRLGGQKRYLDYSKIEFTYQRRVNSMGLCEREIPLDKRPGEYRVVALGDSFTEGVGTSSDTTWVKVLERHLAAAMPDRLVTTINAGISGSDPVYQYVLLRDKLIPFKPDLVIVAVNPTDVNDVIIRGGMERFRPDGSTQYARTAPPWERAYAASYIVRLIVHDVLRYNWLLIKESRMEAPTRVALDELVSALAAFQKLSVEHDFDLLVVLHPASYHEVFYNQYSNDLGRLVSLMKDKNSIHVLDLLDYYQRTGVMTKENVLSFFWSVDGHHNSVGYRAMGDAIAKTVLGSMSAPRSRRDESSAPTVHHRSLEEQTPSRSRFLSAGEN